MINLHHQKTAFLTKVQRDDSDKIVRCRSEFEEYRSGTISHQGPHNRFHNLLAHHKLFARTLYKKVT